MVPSLPQQMQAAVFDGQSSELEIKSVAVPEPGKGQVLIRVEACAVCRTDLHVVDGDLTEPQLPLIPGHEVVGWVVATGPDGDRSTLGQRVGVPWLGWTCGKCDYCRQGRENLCDAARFTGYTLNGGFAEYCLAYADYCFPIPEGYEAVKAAPLLCAGLIGFRAYRLAGGEDVEYLGLYGFGAAAHILARIAVHQGVKVFAFTRPGDSQAQAFAAEMGVVWSGGSDEAPPEPLDAAIIFAPVGDLVPAALRAVRKGGQVVCGGIHMSDIPSFPYSLLWEERCIASVANLTRADGRAFFEQLEEVDIRPQTRTYSLVHANQALDDLRASRFSGAAVLVMDAASR